MHAWVEAAHRCSCLPWVSVDQPSAPSSHPRSKDERDVMIDLPYTAHHVGFKAVQWVHYVLDVYQILPHTCSVPYDTFTYLFGLVV